MKSLKERLEEKIKMDADEKYYQNNDKCIYRIGAASLVALVVELAEGLSRISEFESLPLDDSKTLLKKHNMMAVFSREALQSIEKFLEGDK